MIRDDQPGGGYLLDHDGCEIPFRLIRRKRSRLTINVYPDLRVEVLAPLEAALEKIQQRVQRRASWIVKQWRYFEQFQPSQPARRYVGGETHRYLGRQYRLKIAAAEEKSVRLIGRFFRIEVADPDDTAQVRSLLDAWYATHAEDLFASRLRSLLLESRPLADLKAPRLLVRPMNRRWGSCSKRGTITLNIELVKVPLVYIDYVIVHELCHLKIHRHDEAFYRLLDRSMPDWRWRKERLDRFPIDP